MNYNYNDYELVMLVNENHEEAFSILLTKYEPLIKRIASDYTKKYGYLKLEFEDFVQEGRIAVYYAASHFDYGRSVLFYTYVLAVIHSKMKNLVRRCQSQKNYALTTALNEDEGFDIPFETNFLSDIYFVDLLYSFKNQLSLEEAQVFEMRLYDTRYKDIAFFLEMEVNHVIYLMGEVRKKFKKYLLVS